MEDQSCAEKGCPRILDLADEQILASQVVVIVEADERSRVCHCILSLVGRRSKQVRRGRSASMLVTGLAYCSTSKGGAGYLRGLGPDRLARGASVSSRRLHFAMAEQLPSHWKALPHRESPRGESMAAGGHLEAFLRLFAETPYMRRLIREREACAAVVTGFLESGAESPHRYQGRGSSQLPGLCVGIGGVRIDRALTTRILDAVSPHAVEAALQAAEQVRPGRRRAAGRAVERELDEAQYEASLAARRYELIPPSGMSRASWRRGETPRWSALSKSSNALSGWTPSGRLIRGSIQAALFALAHDLPAVWNAPTTSTGTKQRLIRTLIEEVIIDLDDEANEAVVTIHWVGGRHSETRVSAGPGSAAIRPTPGPPRPT